MSVVISVEDAGPCRKALKVEVPAPAVEAETRRVIEEYGRKAQLPGFRKGRVPRQVIERRFRQEIEQDVLERLLPRYWRQAEAESGLRTLLAPQFEEVDLQPDAPLTFRASVDVRPDIQVADLDDLRLPPAEIEVSDDELTAALDDLRRSHAELRTVERGALQGDVVDVQLQELPAVTETAGEAVPPAAAEPQKVRVEIGDPQVWEELAVALTGLAAGQEAEFSRTTHHHAHSHGDQPDDHQHDHQHVRRFRAHVDAVQERDLPPLDDAFAAKVGKFDNAEALRAAMLASLQRTKKQERQREREHQLLEQLRQLHPTQLPERVVQEELKSQLNDFASYVSRQGMDLDKIDWHQMSEQMRPQAAARVHAELVLDAIAEARSIRLSEREFEVTLSAIARQEKSNTMAVRQALDRAGRLAPLRDDLTRRKVIRQLLGDDQDETAAAVASAE